MRISIFWGEKTQKSADRRRQRRHRRIFFEGREYKYSEYNRAREKRLNNTDRPLFWLTSYGSISPTQPCWLSLFKQNCFFLLFYLLLYIFSSTLLFSLSLFFYNVLPFRHKTGEKTDVTTLRNFLPPQERWWFMYTWTTLIRNDVGRHQFIKTKSTLSLCDALSLPF